MDSAIEYRLLCGELADEIVETLCRRDDVAALLVKVCGECVRLLKQAAHVLLAATEGGTQRLNDVSGLPHATTVEDE